MPKIKPKEFPKPKIGKPKFTKEIKSIKKIPITKINKTAFYKHPGEKAINVSKDRLNSFKVIDNVKYTKMLESIYKKRKDKGKLKDIREKGSLFYFQEVNPRVFGNAIPSMFSFMESIFKYPKTKHGYDVIAVVNAKKEVIGYTTVKINHTFMKNIQVKIREHMKNKNVSLLRARDDFTRIFSSMISKKEKSSRQKVNQTLNFYKLLEKYKFEVYFTPEKGYKLNKDFNFVKDK